jgi:hypothetical protein
MLSAMLEAKSRDRSEALRPPGGFVRRDVTAGRHAGLSVLKQELKILEPESEGYDPYDHVPPLPADDDSRAA